VRTMIITLLKLVRTITITPWKIWEL
jgi:hypothetical protein